MSPRLEEYFEGAGKTYFPSTLLRGFRPPHASAFSIIHPTLNRNLSYDNISNLDTSFPAQMRDAVRAGVFTDKTVVVVTARSGIPCADAVRGFAEAAGITPRAYEYVAPHSKTTETKRLRDIFCAIKPGSALIIDEYVESGAALRAASCIVTAALGKSGCVAAPVGAVAGKWYRRLTPGISSDLAYDFPELDGRRFIDYDTVSLPEISNTMKAAGQITVGLLKLDLSDPSMQQEYIHRQLGNIA